MSEREQDRSLSRRAFVAGVGGALLLGPRRVLADDTSDALASIAKARAGLKTLVAPFAQERSVGLLATSVKSTGA